MKKYNIINNAMGWLCFVIAALTYLLTLEPTASFWDCPEFIAQGAKLEVGHPPGNPIFMLTARFFVTIFGGNIANAAIAVNTMSALLSAATILLLFWTITHLVRRIVLPDNPEKVSLIEMLVIMGSGLCGALAFTWSDTFWFSAVEGEVYAFSSFCTALVFWLILKWENRADMPHSDRYLVLIAYVIGVSIAVHLLNLLCIPAIVLVFYYRKWKNINAKGSLIALGISFVIVAAILYGLVPGFIKVAQGFELFFVNVCGMGYNMGVLIYAIFLLLLFSAAIFTLQTQRPQAAAVKWLMLLIAVSSGLTFITNSGWVWFGLIVAAAAYLFIFCKQVPQRVFNVIVLSIFVIFIGYSSYALLLIRASANTPMNQNAPDNVFALSSYLNREQYGQRPLLVGPAFADTYQYTQDENGMVYVAVDDNGMPVVTPLSMSDAIYYHPDGNGSYAPAISYENTYTKVAKTSPDQPDEYVKEIEVPDYTTAPGLDMFLPRIYSFDPAHVNGYKSWSMYSNPDLEALAQAPQSLRAQWAQVGWAPIYQMAPYLKNIEYIDLTSDGDDRLKLPVWKASMADNLRYFLNYQLNHMYWRYFMWNFAGRQNDLQGNGEPNLGNWISGIPFIDNARLGDQSLLPARYTTENKGHNVFYMLPLLMGILGLAWQALARHRRHPNRGIEQFWVIFFLFFMTGIAIVLYLNQTPGQPRERDYAFAGSFYAFAIWIGMGVAAAYHWISRLLFNITHKKGAKAQIDEEYDPAFKPLDLTAAIWACAIAVLIPLQMVSETWDDHDRSHRYTTRDFGANYLNSLEPNAIIFTNGDNDTFPLWYQQEVEGTRTDVRVVNLSYLSTDWYANQMRHPFYDAPAIKTTALPTDYAYERLSYNRTSRNPLTYNEDTLHSIFPTESRYEAISALERFYGNPEAGIQTPRMISLVDPQAAIAAFGINPESADSTEVLPYLGNINMDGLARGGSLSALLSFDIVANSIADGFERPVYFASTVPNDFYLGLDPYLYSTGMAQQVTPFNDAPASPLATKAYENILTKYRWGGLDDPDHGSNLYLDETVRRMVSTTRNSLIDVAEQLMARGSEPASEFAVAYAKEHGQPVPANKYDMARILLNLLEEKLPYTATPYENLTDLQLVSLYTRLYHLTGNADDEARARALIDLSVPFYADLIKYGASVGTRQLSRTDRSLIQYFPMVVVYQNYLDLADKLKQANVTMPEDMALSIDNALNFDNAAYMFDFALQDAVTAEDLLDYSTKTADELYSNLCIWAAALAAANDEAGIDRSSYARDWLQSKNIDYKLLVRSQH